MTTPEDFPDIPVVRSPRRRRIAAAVAADGSVTIHAPLYASGAQIARAWRQLAPWVERKRALLARNPESRPLAFCFAPGQFFFYLGEAYCLILQPIPPGAPTIRLAEKALLTASAEAGVIRAGLEAFYRDRLRRIVTAKIATFTARFGISVGTISIGGARRRFGSCNAAGDLRFSWRLAMYPEHLIEFVILHELAHRSEMNHSPAFHRVLARYVPDHRERERDLQLWSRKLSAYPK